MQRYIERNGISVSFSPTNSLKFIVDKDGKRILHQLFVEDTSSRIKPVQRIWLEV